ncbi:hypothetical protein AS188_10615 [Kocuria flava]|uniref:Uncharacterized protein n=1 Tax=Kocuria flava TaxID=446860 RepID=A0A0U3HH27_9MICC|nr:hypothetical protein [Kocuria flava]ALU40120.1 hypothetical protein AS188_10615 [Kocuria flava]GEO91044.1 hypothetical protein KFL01_03500 [Kocuria flava]
MADASVLALEALILALPLLGYPALIVVQLVVVLPVLRREAVTEARRTAAVVLAVLSLPAAAPLLLTVWALGLFGLTLLTGLAVPAVPTLVRLRRSGPPVDRARRAG